MFKINKKLLFIILPFFLNDSFAQNAFHIKGTFKKYSGKIYLEYAEHLDSTLVADGKFEFKGEVDLPTKANFRIKNPLPISWTPFIIDPSTLIMEVDTTTMISDKKRRISIVSKVVGGGATTLMIDSFQKVVAPKVMAAKTNEEQMRIFVSEAKVFMKSNPNQIAPLSVISNAYNIFSDEDLKEIYSNLSIKLRSASYAKIIKRKIDKGEIALVGTTIQDFQQADMNGKMISISSLRGRYILIDFWASWCGPCREENPKLIKLYKEYKGKSFEILGVSLDTQRDLWLSAVKKDKLPWLQVSDLKGFDNVVSRSFKISSIPDNVLIDKEGKIIAKNLSYEELEKKIKEIL